MNFEAFIGGFISMENPVVNWITEMFTTHYSSALGYTWLIAAILLLLLEVGVPGLFFFMSFALGSAAASVCAFLDLSLYIQCTVAIVSSALCLSVLKYIASHKKLITHVSTKHAHTNTDALIGEQALVTVAIEARTPGRIKVKGDEWTAVSLHGTAFHQGSIVTIVRIEGNKLIVM